MPDKSYTLNQVRIFECAPEGSQLRSERDAVELIGSAATVRPDLLVIPVSRLHDDFFKLRTRVAGDILQKFVQYGFRIAILGDISSHVSESTALRDFVYECNSGRQIWFVPSVEKLSELLAGPDQPRNCS
jgi:hypothetical protein